MSKRISSKKKMRNVRNVRNVAVVGNENEGLKSFLSMNFDGVFSNAPAIIEVKDEKRNVWLDKRRKFFTASNAGKFMTFDFSENEITEIENEIAETKKAIAESKTGKTKTLNLKLERLERKLDSANSLPKGALNAAKDVAIARITKFNHIRAGNFKSREMQWGCENELNAIAVFEKETGLVVSKTGENQEFIEFKEFIGGTPDGIIDSEGSGVEVKCPASINHAEFLKCNHQHDLLNINPDYYWQCVHLMLCTGACHWYFVSYDPDFLNEEKMIKIIKVNRIEEEICRLNNRLIGLIDFVIQYLKDF